MKGRPGNRREECEKVGPVIWDLERTIDITAAVIVPSGTVVTRYLGEFK